ncbi:MAG: DUF4342 domain-containing protein [Hyphomicrobiales bacterium]|nr:MAG: DUF4342 domain-containing protein [Hyphomicrobiales bacterium]
MSDDDNRKNGWKTFTEEIEVTGQQLLETINRLIAEGNVRKLNIKSETGDVYLSVPLTGGAVAGGILVLGAPWLALIAGVAGLLAKVKLEVVRAEPPADDKPNDEPDI